MGFAILAAAVVSPVQASAQTLTPETAEVRARVAELNKRLQPAVENAESTECVFHRQEYKHEVLEPVTVLIKRNRHGDVFLRFIDGSQAGREILYRPGKNDGKLLVSTAVINIDLDPHGRIAMRSNRYPITMAGPTATARRILQDLDRLADLPPEAVRNEWIGARDIRGEPATCYRSMLDKANYPELFAFQTEICLSDASGLPIDVQVWDRDRPTDKEIRLVGHYTYEDCRFNHLTEKDFDPDNPDYKF